MPDKALELAEEIRQARERTKRTQQEGGVETARRMAEVRKRIEILMATVMMKLTDIALEESGNRQVFRECGEERLEVFYGPDSVTISDRVILRGTGPGYAIACTNSRGFRLTVARGGEWKWLPDNQTCESAMVQDLADYAVHRFLKCVAR